jgi:hypothetical protein
VAKGENAQSRKGAAKAPHVEPDPTHIGSSNGKGVRFTMPSGTSPMTKEMCPETSRK